MPLCFHAVVYIELGNMSVLKKKDRPRYSVISCILKLYAILSDDAVNVRKHQQYFLIISFDAFEFPKLGH